ncbi:MAG: FeoB-associated Cys-rich membrane protein [Sphaerochaetaceae bacterium]|nr:FeoB-associated Cys-rich membrane protein [Sphaerochaetaceae bacterium]
MNTSTFIVLIILIAIVALIIYSMRKDKKKGKNSCGHKCSGCAMAGQCHGAKTQNKG